MIDRSSSLSENPHRKDQEKSKLTFTNLSKKGSDGKQGPIENMKIDYSYKLFRKQLEKWTLAYIQFIALLFGGVDFVILLALVLSRLP